jgi:hypothetical protein
MAKKKKDDSSTSTPLQVDRENVEALFNALGVKSDMSKVTDARLLGRIHKMGTQLATKRDKDVGEYQQLFHDLLDAVAQNRDIEILSDSEDANTPPPEVKKGKSVPAKAGKKAGKKDAKAGKKAGKKDAKADKKATSTREFDSFGSVVDSVRARVNAAMGTGWHTPTEIFDLVKAEDGQKAGIRKHLGLQVEAGQFENKDGKYRVNPKRTKVKK